jgi:hypothetical protein
MKCRHLLCLVLAILSLGALPRPLPLAQTTPEPKTSIEWFQRARSNEPAHARLHALSYESDLSRAPRNRTPRPQREIQHSDR